MSGVGRGARVPCLLVSAALAAGCASTSVSPVREMEVAGSAVEISARAERGSTRDQLFLTVNGRDVASAPFDASTAPIVVLRADHGGVELAARCRHRWRPGLHIGYRCSVEGPDGPALELDF